MYYSIPMVLLFSFLATIETVSNIRTALVGLAWRISWGGVKYVVGQLMHMYSRGVGVCILLRAMRPGLTLGRTEYCKVFTSQQVNRTRTICIISVCI